MNYDRLNRRDFLQKMGFAAACLTGINSSGFAETVSGRSPNVLLIVADDMGWADLGCYGNRWHETPNIDRLSAGGVRFSDAYAASPVCTPTRASIMTGKSPARLHMTTWHERTTDIPQDLPLLPAAAEGNLPLSEKTLAEALREWSYFTAHIGKWHLGDAAHYPETQGFDANIGGTFWGAPQTFFYPYAGQGMWEQGEYRYVPHLELGREGEYLTDRLTDEALRLIEASRDRPFFYQSQLPFCTYADRG